MNHGANLRQLELFDANIIRCGRKT